MISQLQALTCSVYPLVSNDPHKEGFRIVKKKKADEENRSFFSSIALEAKSIYVFISRLFFPLGQVSGTSRPKKSDPSSKTLKTVDKDLDVQKKSRDLSSQPTRAISLVRAQVLATSAHTFRRLPSKQWQTR